MSLTRIPCPVCGHPMAWCQCAPVTYTIWIREAGQWFKSGDADSLSDALDLAGSINHPEDAIEIRDSTGKII